MDAKTMSANMTNSSLNTCPTDEYRSLHIKQHKSERNTCVWYISVTCQK